MPGDKVLVVSRSAIGPPAPSAQNPPLRGCQFVGGSLLPPRAAQWPPHKMAPLPTAGSPQGFFAARFQKNKKSPWVGCLAALVISLFSARACPTCHPQAHRSRSLGVAAASIGRRRSLKLPAWLHFFGPRLSSRAGAIARTSRVNPGSCMRCLFQRAIPTAWTSLVNPSSCMPWVV